MTGEILIAPLNQAETLAAKASAPEDFDGIPANGLSEKNLRGLHGILTGAEVGPYPSVGNGPTVFILPDEFIRHMAGLNDDLIFGLADQAADLDAFAVEGWDAETVAEFMTDFRELCQDAKAGKDGIYLWCE